MIRRTTIGALGALLVATAARAAIPAVITYNGYLLDGSGAPVTSASTLAFNLYAGAEGGTPINAAPISVAVVPAADGYFTAAIETTAYGAAFGDPVYLGIAFGSEAEMSPRVRLTPAPYALAADAVAWSGVRGFPATACPAGQAVTGIGADGVPACGAVVGAVSAAPGAGVAVTGLAASRTVGLVGCEAGQVLKAAATAGQWACAADANSGGTVTHVTGIAPIAVDTSTVHPAVSISQAGAATSGYLSSADWTAFNAKQARVTGNCPTGAITGIAANGGVSCGLPTLSCTTQSYNWTSNGVATVVCGAGTTLTGGGVYCASAARVIQSRPGNNDWSGQCDAAPAAGSSHTVYVRCCAMQ